MTPGSGPRRKSVHRGAKKRPLASSGTPRTTFPRAAPRKTARSALASEKTTSQKSLQIGCWRWFRNSIAIPRRMRSQSTIMSGR